MTKSISWKSEYLFDKKIHLGKKLSIKASMRHSNSYMGRFGGGWQWELGFQTGSLSPQQLKEYGFTLIINLLVASIRINYRTNACIARDLRWEQERKEREQNANTATNTTINSSDTPF